jgi:hypothetical protein
MQMTGVCGQVRGAGGVLSARSQPHYLARGLGALPQLPPVSLGGSTGQWNNQKALRARLGWGSL